MAARRVSQAGGGVVEITIDTSGLDAASKQLDPKNVYTALTQWYKTSTVYVRDGMRARVKSRIKGKVKIRTDGFLPPRWARVRVYSPLGHILEGGTGRLGAPGFNHSSRHFPRVTGDGGLMQTMGLPKAEAFAVAKSISERGGNRAQPFVHATYIATKAHVEHLAEEALKKAFGI